MRIHVPPSDGARGPGVPRGIGMITPRGMLAGHGPSWPRGRGHVHPAGGRSHAGTSAPAKRRTSSSARGRTGSGSIAIGICRLTPARIAAARSGGKHPANPLHSFPPYSKSQSMSWFLTTSRHRRRRGLHVDGRASVAEAAPAGAGARQLFGPLGGAVDRAVDLGAEDKEAGGSS